MRGDVWVNVMLWLPATDSALLQRMGLRIANKRDAVVRCSSMVGTGGQKVLASSTATFVEYDGCQWGGRKNVPQEHLGRCGNARKRSLCRRAPAIGFS